MKRLLLSGFIYTAVGRYGGVVISLVVDIILSRLLTPSDYGIVAVVNVFLVFFSLFSDSGIGTAVVQNRTLSKKDISVLFTWSIMVAFIMAVMFGLLGMLVSLFYNNTVYSRLMWVLAIAVFFLVFISIPKAILLQKNRFASINLISLFASVIGGITGITVAMWGGGAYALVVNTLTTGLVNFVVIFYLSRVRFTTKMEWNPVKKILSFSVNNLGFSLLNQFSHNLAPLLIGKFMTSVDTGNYNKAYRLILYPTAMFNGLIAPVLLPVLSGFQNDIVTVRMVYLRLQHITGLISIPLSFFLFFSSHDIISVLYGRQWINAATPLALLSLSVWAQMLNANAEPIFQILGKMRLLMKLGFRTSMINILATTLGVLTGDLKLVAFFLLVSFTVNGFYVSYLVMTSALKSTIWEMIRVLKSGIIIGVFISIALLSYKFFFRDFTSLVSLIIESSISVILFGILAFLLGEITNITNIFLKK